MRSRIGIQAALYISLDLLAELTVLIEYFNSVIELNNDGEQRRPPAFYPRTDCLPAGKL